MPLPFEIIDYVPTRLGDLMLRRREEPALGGQEVFEVKLGDDFLMSSLFYEAEVALADLGLAELPAACSGLDVVVGGLGLGYTARAALTDSRVASLRVIDGLAEVIDWHQRGLVPLGTELSADPRCRFVHADFFALAPPQGTGFDPELPGQRIHALLLDIDHAPDKLLDPSHAGFYTREGLEKLFDLLHPGGVFALWSNDPPDPDFLALLAQCFDTARAEVVPFRNPLTGGEESNTVYLALRSDV